MRLSRREAVIAGASALALSGCSRHARNTLDFWAMGAEAEHFPDLLASLPRASLSGKGTTAYSQQNHVPMLIVHPEFPGGQRCSETTSHLDFVPTIVAMIGNMKSEIEAPLPR